MPGLIWVICQCLLFLHASASQIPDFTPEIEEQIASFIEATMHCRDIPGLILSIVHKGEVATLRGFGVTDLESMEPVTENTLFGIGSVTKAFTANLVAVLLDESDGLYTWDTTLREIFGDEFTLTDDIRTEHTTIRDILSHKVNLYTYGPTLLTLYPAGTERLELCSQLNNLEAASGFRTDFIYDNMMFMLAGCVAELIGGQPYSELLRTRILEPLNMTSSVLASEVSDFSQVPSSYIYSQQDQELLVIDKNVLSLGPLEPAGALFSSTEDMSNWMITQLNSGTFGGEPVIPQEFWQETQQGSNFVPRSSLSYSKPTFPFYLDTPVYGFGWFLGTYEGYNIVYHTGGIGGFATVLILYPDLQTSVFMSASSSGNSGAGYGLQTPVWFISDLLTGAEPFLNETTSCTFPEPWVTAEEVKKNAGNLANFDLMKPLTSEDEYIPYVSKSNDWIIENHQYFEGDYENSLFGNFSIGFNETRARLTFTQGLNGEGSLIPVDVEEPTEQKNFYLAFEGSLYNLLRAVGGRIIPLYFENFENELYQDLVAVGYEPNAPPVFVRGLK